MKIKITLTGTDQAIQKLKQRGVNLQDFSKELTEGGKYLVDFHRRDVFESEGQVINEKWRPLDPKYEYAKRIKYPGRGILEASGTLRRGFEFYAGKTRMVFKNTKTKYGRTHQLGDPSRNIPARVFFKIDAQRQRGLVDIIHQGIIKKLHG